LISFALFQTDFVQTSACFEKMQTKPCGFDLSEAGRQNCHVVGLQVRAHQVAQTADLYASTAVVFPFRSAGHQLPYTQEETWNIFVF